MSLETNATSLDWDELLLFITEGRVIPIVGRELLVVETLAGEALFGDLLAAELARALELSPEGLSPRPQLDEVATVYTQSGGQRRKIYSKLRSLAASPAILPRSLRLLAEIFDFRLFLSTTFDPLLAETLDAVRFGGEPHTQRAAFSPHLQLEDLPCEIRLLDRPWVFQLFGRLSASADYAVTEEDSLEFLHVLQSETHRPPLLFDELGKNHLLLLGCAFPSWLTRFFLRTVKNRRLLIPRETSEIVADREVAADPALTQFLRLYSTEVIGTGGAVEFVDELHRRWQKLRGGAGIEPTRPAPRAAAMPAGAIFLSYASEDREIAAQVVADLESAGLEVWFDRDKLTAGDAWDLEIRRNIHSCSLFLPLLSPGSQRRLEGYFRKEWHWAVERAHGFDEAFPFLIPLVAEGVAHRATGFPEYFWTRQGVRLEQGRAPSEFISRTREIIRELRRREAGYQ